MSTLLEDAIAAKMRSGMSIEDTYNTYGFIPWTLLGAIRRPEHIYPQETVDVCLSRVRDGEPIQHVARATGVPHSTVRTWCKKYHVKSKWGKWPKKHAATVAAMWRDGRTCEEIGATIGVSPRAIKGWVQRHRDLCPSRGHGGARRTKRKDKQ